MDEDRQRFYVTKDWITDGILYVEGEASSEDGLTLKYQSEYGDTVYVDYPDWYAFKEDAIEHVRLCLRQTIRMREREIEQLRNLDVTSLIKVVEGVKDDV